MKYGYSAKAEKKIIDSKGSNPFIVHNIVNVDGDDLLMYINLNEEQEDEMHDKYQANIDHNMQFVKKLDLLKYYEKIVLMVIEKLKAKQ